MPDYPSTTWVNQIDISSLSGDSIGIELRAAGEGGISVSGQWPTASTALFVPFCVYRPITIVKMFALNGTTANGNVDVGIYDPSGTRLVSSGATCQTAGGLIQIFDITDTTLNPGLYYMAEARDSGTSLSAGMTAVPTPVIRATGVMMMTSAYPLPATATYATTTASFVPIINATQTTII